MDGAILRNQVLKRRKIHFALPGDPSESPLQEWAENELVARQFVAPEELPQPSRWTSSQTPELIPGKTEDS